MKCKGSYIEKKNGKKFEKKCGNELGEHTIFCDVCGKSTNALSTGLSAKNARKESWDKFKEIKSKSYPFGIFMVLTFLPIIAIFLKFGNNDYFISNLILLFIVPLFLIPFGNEKNFAENPFWISEYFKNLKNYPKLWFFVLLNIIFFFVLKVLCTGFMLGVATDPILHIVRFILVLHWITIVLPAPLVIIRKKVSPINALIMCYKASAETRWQQFYIVLVVFFSNLIALGLLVFGMLVTVPYTYVLIEKYYMRMDEYGLFENKNDLGV
jgi:hypothetical protein